MLFLFFPPVAHRVQDQIQREAPPFIVCFCILYPVGRIYQKRNQSKFLILTEEGKNEFITREREKES
jgi:hypothetical protein